MQQSEPMQPLTIAFLIYPDVTQLDFSGPAQVLSRLGASSMHFVWKCREPVATDSGFSILPTATFDEVGHADILCVPGGFGSGLVGASSPPPHAAKAMSRATGSAAKCRLRIGRM